MDVAASPTAIVNSVMESGTPVNAVASQGTLTVSGVVIDGETCTISEDIYEFATDAAQTVTSGNIAVDITGGATASAGTLTVAVQPIVGDTFTIGDKVFTFTTDGTAATDGQIDVGADLADAKTLIVAAINGTDSINTASEFVTAAAFATNDCVITALVAGTSGDAIATTETFDNVGNVFDAVKLGTTTAGVDCIAATAITALAAAVLASGDGTYTAVDGAGDTVLATAVTKGIAGDLIATTETMANGAWDAAKLGTTTAGVDGTQGKQGVTYQDSSYWYLCLDTNTITDTNWRRFAVGSVY